jgi:RNA-directed DNA polymerase
VLSGFIIRVNILARRLESYSGRVIAVKRVTENKGRNTPGVDEVTWKTPAAKANAIASLKKRGYSPLPLRRVFILKKNGKTGPLGIPTVIS